MRPIVCIALFLLLCLSAVMPGAHGQDKAPTPAERYKALFNEYTMASSSGRPMTDAGVHETI